MVYHRHPKLGVVCDTSCHFILSIRGNKKGGNKKGTFCFM